MLDPKAGSVMRRDDGPGEVTRLLERASGGDLSGEREATPRSDLYAVGWVAYWLLTGRPVFDGETSAEVLAAHLETEPAPPSARATQEVPAALDRIVLDCLAKNPAARPASAAALRARLEAVPLARPWSQARAEAWWRTATGPGSEVPVG